MEKVAQFVSAGSLSLACLILTACARPAPEIPSNSYFDQMASASSYSGANCQDLVNRLAILDIEKRNLETIIASNRQKNQVAGYFGGLFIVPAMAAEHNLEEKARLDKIQQEQDELRAVASKIECIY